MSVDGMRQCLCGRAGCDRMECTTCGMSDCKWPGACYAKCKECGSPARASQLPMHDGSVFMRSDGLGPWMDQYCSKECEDVCWKRADEAGLIVNLSDVTPERANEMFNTIGLQLAGVGPVVSS